jgi:hypothetical protein
MKGASKNFSFYRFSYFVEKIARRPGKSFRLLKHFQDFTLFFIQIVRRYLFQKVLYGKTADNFSLPDKHPVGNILYGNADAGSGGKTLRVEGGIEDHRGKSPVLLTYVPKPELFAAESASRISGKGLLDPETAFAYTGTPQMVKENGQGIPGPEGDPGKRFIGGTHVQGGLHRRVFLAVLKGYPVRHFSTGKQKANRNDKEKPEHPPIIAQNSGYFSEFSKFPRPRKHAKACYSRQSTMAWGSLKATVPKKIKSPAQRSRESALFAQKPHGVGLTGGCSTQKNKKPPGKRR